MFCLRTWISLLLFLQNASPLYIILFLTATYALQRPCVYCSILLFVLVFSLFDFEGEWFETRITRPSTATEWMGGRVEEWCRGNSTISEILSEGASLALCAANGMGDGVGGAAMDGVKRRVGIFGGRYGGEAAQNGFELLRAGLEKWQFRIPCVDVVVRL